MKEDFVKKKPKKKRKMPWVLGSIVLILLTCLFLLQSSNVWRSISVDSASETLLLYALSSLNFIAFIIFAFILIRSLLKLQQERRSLQLGSKIKTRLVLYFVAVSLLPLIAMAVFSYLFMNRALERWFTQIPENVVRKVGEQQEKADKENLEKFKKIAPMLAKSIENKEVKNEGLQEIIEAGDIVRLDVVTNDGKVFASAEKELDTKQKSQIDRALSAIYQSKAVHYPEAIGEDFDLTTAKISDGKRLVMVSDISSMAASQDVVLQSLVTFDELKAEQNLVRQIGFTTLGLLTFLLIFASMWMAFYIAKGLTRPIRALAVGADEIAKGNFSHRVDVIAEDELHLLVKSFNTMAGKLEENSAELRSRRRYIETILQSLSTGVISFDDKNYVRTINKAAVEMFKLEDADVANVELKQLVNEENSQILETLVNRSKRVGLATEQTVLQREKLDGSAEINDSLPVALTATVLPDGDGAVLVIEDLTELLAAQRASAWQEVARRMAHEIKNPLTPIQLSAERIAKRFSKTNEESKGELRLTNYELDSNSKQNQKVIKDGTDTILREVSSLKSMVDEFSRYARLPEVKLQEEDFNKIVSQAVLLYEDRVNEVEIKLDLAKELPTSLLDREQLKRVFVNLIDNSYEAFEGSNTEKNINIKTFYDSARELIVAEFSDNGKGISPRNIPKLFQPYFSTKGRGTGLGLAIVQRIISEHKGQIKAVANSPNGAKFIVEISANNS